MDSKLLTLYSEVQTKPVHWIWYPYIPIGKITILQGDPNDGKSTMMMNLVAELSKGGTMPDGKAVGRPLRIIYQCSEDDAADTIKPRLEACQANSRNIAFINEEVYSGLTLEDERLRQAIAEFRPKLVIIDPLQAYVEGDSDLLHASKARKLMKRIALWASMYECAIVIIGHLNKSSGTKDLYRGLGSIDLVASARSVMQIERQDDVRVVHHIKCSVAPRGPDLRFEIKADTGFHWLEGEPSAGRPVMSSAPDLPKNKHELAMLVIQRLLKDGEPMESSDIQREMAKYKIGDKTLKEVRETMGIKTYRRMRTWYWVLPDGKEEADNEGVGKKEDVARAEGKDRQAV